MTVMLWLGDIKLDALSVLEMPASKAWEYAEHKTIEGLPVLQQTGRNSDVYTLGVRIHPWLGTPASIIASIEAAGDAGEVMVLQSGAGEQLGSYVLTGIEKTRTWCTPKGQLIAGVLSLKLKEHRPIDFEVVSGLAIEGKAASTDFEPVQIDDTRDPSEVPLSEMVRSA